MSLEERASQLTEVEHTFAFHPPRGDQPSRYIALREQAKKMAMAIIEFCPESREKSIALTKLEEVLMWANKSVAVHRQE